ncbi:MAG: hypothetical protein SVM79_00800 [Chloroflexota bacterium]|nr:hypothetical protein [Chloroflexota bacterium]
MRERRMYVTDASPEAVCEFYKNEMPKLGWDKIVYLLWLEGSCTGTWMAEMGDDSGPKVLLGVGQLCELTRLRPLESWWVRDALSRLLDLDYKRKGGTWFITRKESWGGEWP